MTLKEELHVIELLERATKALEALAALKLKELERG